MKRNYTILISLIFILCSSVLLAQQTNIKISDFQYESIFSGEACEEYLIVTAHFSTGEDPDIIINYTGGNNTDVFNQEYIVDGIVEKIEVNIYAQNSDTGVVGCSTSTEIIDELYEAPITLDSCDENVIAHLNTHTTVIEQSFSFTYQVAPFIEVTANAVYDVTDDDISYEGLLNLTADEGFDESIYQWQYSTDHTNWTNLPLPPSRVLEFRPIDILDESVIDQELSFRIASCDDFSSYGSISTTIKELGVITKIDISNFDYDRDFRHGRCKDEIRLTAYFSSGESPQVFLRYRNGSFRIGNGNDNTYYLNGVLDHIRVYLYGRDDMPNGKCSWGIFGSNGGSESSTTRITPTLEPCYSNSFYKYQTDSNAIGNRQLEQTLTFDYKITPLPKLYKEIETNIIGYEDVLTLSALEGFEDIVHDWQYSFLEVGQPLNWIDLPGTSALTRDIVLADYPDHFDESIIGRDIVFRTHSCDGDGSQNVLNYTVRRSAPRIVDVTEAPVSCYDSEDGSITLQFDKPLIEGDVFGFAVSDLNDPDLAVVANLNNVTEFGANNEITIEGLPPSTTNFLVEMVGALYGDIYFTNSDNRRAVFTIDRPTPVAFVDEPTDNSINVFCHGGQDGEITLTAEGGVGNYDYNISTNDQIWNDDNWLPFSEDTSHTITSLFPTTYYIKIRDGNGCIAKEQSLVNEEIELGIDIIKEVVITQPDAPLSVSTEILNHPTAYGFSDGRILAILQGGTPLADDSYTFEWRNQNNQVVNTVNSEYVNGQGYVITLHSVGEGAYTLTATDANYNAATDKEGCTVTTTTINLIQPPPIEISIEVTPISCNANNEYSNNIDTNFDGIADQFQDGVLVATVTGGVPFDIANPDYSITLPSNADGTLLPYFYHWKMQLPNGAWQDIGINDIFIDFLDTATTYSLNVTDKNGIVLGDYVIALETDGSQSYVLQQAQDVEEYLSVPEALEITFTNTDVTCANGNDGNAEVFVSGGIAPYMYEWSTGATTKTLDNLIAGVYRVFVTDANGCEVEGNVIVDQSNNIEIEDISVISPTCFEGNDGFIDINVTGGTAPYTYSWNTGATTSMIQNLSAGEYIIEITDNSECKAFKTWTLVNPEPVVVNLEQNRSICDNQILDINITIDDPNATYSWASENGFTSSSASVSLIEAGTYTATITNGLGCIGMGTIEVEAFDRPIDSYFLITTQAYADDEIILINVSSPIGERIEWTLPDVCEIISQTNEELIIKFEQEGTYEINLRSYQGDCYEDFSKTILVQPASDIPSEYYSSTNFIEEFIVYPSPNSGTFNTKITLSEESNISVKIISMVSGAIMEERRLENNIEFLLDYSISLPTGMYLMLLETAKGSDTRKLIIE
ncbi:T9SS type A sorting domain-containing protein [Aquimarina pacifica]|uniref:T9SS type A sorting domain-containing protein n=1 Tax=Aquimarina pacifica TaxID=1296415 RepID=UPI000471DCE1|nr:T9SS type A sorting domain-containing protein [Aquimarina pacifica]